MGKKNEWVEVENRKLKLSNLNKKIYPDENYTKARILEYYLNIAPVMLRHISGRPLTLIRYPDGINGKNFFQKEKPDYTPEWIESVELGEENKINYLVANEKATLIWIANLAGLEIHQLHGRKSHPEYPDYMVFDLDPPENSDFKEVVKIAFELKEHLEQYEYHTFVKTTGGKGVHLVVPLKPENETDIVFEVAKEIARSFVDKHKDRTTLQIRKKERKGRILIDIYRNRSNQTIVAPYSLRARPGAPVSMPLNWQELEKTDSSGKYHLKNAVDKVQADGDAWEHIAEYATRLHTQRDESDKSNESETSENKPSESEHYKSPEQLKEYEQKRNFTRTSEPEVKQVKGEGNRFTLQRHQATRLHYDLRLEQDGVLKSWAVPKGLPPRPGIKRLAVQTEDHPLEYLTFEGEIPKGEYGAGLMRIFASGSYEISKQKENSLHFHLKSSRLNGNYRMYRIEDKEWLLEKVDKPKIDWLQDEIKPMHAKRVTKPPDDGYLYEIKWDGIRAFISLDEGEIKIHTRNRNEVTDKFPELQKTDSLRASSGLFDGEIVYLDENGKPQFQKIINRLRSTSQKKIEMKSKSNPVYCYLFDCLYLDGRPLTDEPFISRYELLESVIKKGTYYRLSETMNDGKKLFEAAKKHNLEGIMAKKKESRYEPGKRTDLWLKVKSQKTADCLIIGYTKGSGERSSYFGALHLAEEVDGELKYRGKVGTGFDAKILKDVNEELEKLPETKKPIEHPVQDEKNTVWVEPELVVEINYSSFTDEKLFREAVFNRLRPDLKKPE